MAFDDERSAARSFCTRLDIYVFGRDDPQQHPRVNAAEVALITAGQRHADPGNGTVPAWKRVLQNRDALFMTLSYASMNFVFYVVFSWGFYYLVTVRGFAEQEAGFLTSAQWMAGGAGAAFGGWLGDRLCRRIGLRWGSRLPIIIGSSVSAVLLLSGVAAAFGWKVAISVGAVFAMLAVVFILMSRADRQMDQSG